MMLILYIILNPLTSTTAIINMVNLPTYPTARVCSGIEYVTSLSPNCHPSSPYHVTFSRHQATGRPGAVPVLLFWDSLELTTTRWYADLVARHIIRNFAKLLRRSSRRRVGRGRVGAKRPRGSV